MDIYNNSYIPLSGREWLKQKINKTLEYINYYEKV